MFATFFFIAVPIAAFIVSVLNMYLSFKTGLIYLRYTDVIWAGIISVIPVLNLVWIIAMLLMFYEDRHIFLKYVRGDK